MSTVMFEKDGAVGVVTLSKPPHNLIEDAFLKDLLRAYGQAVEHGLPVDPAAQRMRHFCAGADVAGFASGGRRRDQASLEALLDALENVPLPSVAAVHGGALGGGFELALTCDMIVAADTAFFGMAEAVARPAAAARRRAASRAARRSGARKGNGDVRPAPRPAALERWGVINLVAAEVRIAGRIDVVGAATGWPALPSRCAASRRWRICRRATASRARMRSRPT